jgi:hypothetical protein
MASLTISVGALSSTATASNTVASEILDLYAQTLDGYESATNQQRLDIVRADVVRHIRNVARIQRIRNEERPAQNAGQTAANALEWS